jgi:hypothetical protein
MGLGDLLKELRLMKGQHGYRYCLAWLVVAVHTCARPSLIAFGIWVLGSRTVDGTESQAMNSLLKLVAFAIQKYFQHG